MTKEECDIQRELKVQRHSEKTGHVTKTCRYLGVGRSSFYRWKTALEQRGQAGLVNAKPIPKNLPTRHRPRSLTRFYTCAANTPSDRSGSLVLGALSWHQDTRWVSRELDDEFPFTSAN
tara:strand:+ start:5014 stop:5370 length:357 start_codon:yes stop_codon:yes gene_type:complete